MQEVFRVFIGWDSTQTEAYQVCEFSLKRHASIPIIITPLKLEDLRDQGLYWRDTDPLASTEFAYSRFLVPRLAEYSGPALFCDCDFLWTSDVAGLIALSDPSKAVQCVWHDYRPTQALKMEGKPQTQYPRKNWSSLMLFTCEHPATMGLTPEVVNSREGSYLQRLLWAPDDAIGKLPGDWNWLEGWDETPKDRPPNAIHFTRGGPWFAAWQNVEFANLWRRELELMRKAAISV